MIRKGEMGTCRYFTVILILLLLLPLLEAQDRQDRHMVRYSPDYEFMDGIYMNPEMVKTNRPIPPARIVSERNKFDNQFYNDLLKMELIALNNDRGVREFIKPTQLWGYACNGDLYIQIGKSFQRLTLEGNISRFMASATTFKEGTTKQMDSGPYPSRYYHRPYGRRPAYSYATLSRGEYLYDLETNIMYNDNPDDLEKILIRDSQLLLEYSSLKRSQKKKRKLEFIKRYNESHPLYLPVINKD
jgi:hypothetical protein